MADVVTVRCLYVVSIVKNVIFNTLILNTLRWSFSFDLFGLSGSISPLLQVLWKSLYLCFVKIRYVVYPDCYFYFHVYHIFYLNGFSFNSSLEDNVMDFNQRLLVIIQYAWLSLF